MAKYELILILNPNTTEVDRNNSLSNFKKTLWELWVKIEKEDIWWNKKMAYKINSSDNGFYILFILEMDWKIITNLTKFINLDMNIWRHMFVKQYI